MGLMMWAVLLQSWHVWWGARGKPSSLKIADASELIGSCLPGCAKHCLSPSSSILQSVRAAYAEYEELSSCPDNPDPVSDVSLLSFLPASCVFACLVAVYG